jgi:hypothetical protein
LRTFKARCCPESSRMDQRTVPTLVELVVPLKLFTQMDEVVGGLTKSARLLEMQADAPPSTKTLKESKSKIVRQDLSSETTAAALALAIPVARADKASRCTAAREGERRRKRHQEKFHLSNRYLRHHNT